MLPSLSLPPLECCFGTSPIQAEKFRPDRKAFGSGTLATRAVASAGPTPGIASSRLLVSLDRCQTVIIPVELQDLRLEHSQLGAPWPSRARRRAFFRAWGDQQEFFGLTAPAHAPNVPPRGRPSRSQGRSLYSR